MHCMIVRLIIIDYAMSLGLGLEERKETRNLDLEDPQVFVETGKSLPGPKPLMIDQLTVTDGAFIILPRDIFRKRPIRRACTPFK